MTPRPDTQNSPECPDTAWAGFPSLCQNIVPLLVPYLFRRVKIVFSMMTAVRAMTSISISAGDFPIPAGGLIFLKVNVFALTSPKTGCVKAFFILK
jgi:hypothetical protein